MRKDVNVWAGKTVSSVADGYEAFVLAQIANAKKPVIYIASDGVSLAQTATMLRFLHPEYEVLEFPAWDTVPYDRVSPNSALSAKRIETLAKIVFYDEKTPLVVVTSVGAVLQKLAPAKIFRNARKLVKVGEKLDFDSFLHYVSLNGYTRVEQVMEPGEYAVRGDIADIFPSGMDNPLRIDLFDDEVERLRIFDAVSQRTIGDLQQYEFQVATPTLSAISVNNIESFLGPMVCTMKYMRQFPTGKNISVWKIGCRCFITMFCRLCLIICRMRKSWRGKILKSP